MPFSITDLTRKDETAEKIPTKGKGLGAFTSPSGYATILCFPITIWQSRRNTKKTVESLREARELETERVEAERREEAEEERKRAELRAKSYANRDGPGPQGPPREKKVPEVEPLDPRLDRDPENPRVCDNTCGNAWSSHCPIHDRKHSSRPTSPGLLAI
ncbi:uncharacterized protein B0J16DRAFT_368952 [Fusarium flagelliforme]|uniref:Uncharacterized protein n=1 Tax=Fusarium flagelliforme TaxID=2675880 RepID=A0A395MRY1_9HYPO|nr:uncharacterized protein B0J16DRAFT_368952 [Fusarium flagelliforme]KAH7192748.1 hypothetical protein B0J16DRAFT_368952 [Fusarium flagelliforme]RFN49879.1 hypothetical protein FIE12Z_5866 [Fusarium flagelliforme]